MFLIYSSIVHCHYILSVYLVTQRLSYSLALKKDPILNCCTLKYHPKDPTFHVRRHWVEYRTRRVKWEKQSLHQCFTSMYTGQCSLRYILKLSLTEKSTQDTSQWGQNSIIRERSIQVFRLQVRLTSYTCVEKVRFQHTSFFPTNFGLDF